MHCARVLWFASSRVPASAAAAAKCPASAAHARHASEQPGWPSLFAASCAPCVPRPTAGLAQCVCSVCVGTVIRNKMQCKETCDRSCGGQKQCNFQARQEPHRRRHTSCGVKSAISCVSGWFVLCAVVSVARGCMPCLGLRGNPVLHKLKMQSAPACEIHQGQRAGQAKRAQLGTQSSTRVGARCPLRDPGHTGRPAATCVHTDRRAPDGSKALEAPVRTFVVPQICFALCRMQCLFRPKVKHRCAQARAAGARRAMDLLALVVSAVLLCGPGARASTITLARTPPCALLCPAPA